MSGYFLSKAPNGLLGALDLKNLGRNPQTFGAELEPSIDVLPFYLLPNRQCLAGSGAWTAVNVGIALGAAAPFDRYFSGGNFVVPNSETIRIKSMAVLNTRNAADAGLTLSAGVFIRRTTGTLTIAIGNAIFPARPATDLSQAVAIPLTEPLWLGPGDFLRLVPETTQTAAGSSIGIQLDFDSVPSG